MCSIESKFIFHVDVSPMDNYWETVLPQYEAKLKAAGSDTKKIAEIQKNYDQLMHVGFMRRLQSMHEVPKFGKRSTMDGMIQDCAEEAFREFERLTGQRLSPEKRKRKKSGFFSTLSTQLKYLSSLRKKPGLFELVKNVLLVAPFVWAVGKGTGDVWNKLGFSLIGHTVLIVALVLRGRPWNTFSTFLAKEFYPFESTAMRTALWTNLLYTGVAFTTVSTLTSLFLTAFDFNTRFSTTLSATLLASCLAASIYEVYEPRERDGWRWEHFMELEEGMGSLTGTPSGSPAAAESLTQLYDFAYDPEVDDDQAAQRDASLLLANGMDPDAVSEIESSQKHYEDFRRQVQASRKAPIDYDENNLEALNELIGAQPGFLLPEKDIPDWMHEAYDQHVTGKADWQQVPRVQRIDQFTPDEDIKHIGPKFFRDKRPKWMAELSPESEEVDPDEETRKLARQYGTYRKAMYKVDKEIVLDPSDGINIGYD